MTLLEISILLHYYASVGDFPNCDGVAQRTAIQKFLKFGVLRESFCSGGQKYEGNRDALSVYIHAIASVPLPKQKWVIEHTLMNECKGVKE